MKRSAFALLLLSTFLLGLVAGPHPCHEAASGERRMSGHSSCHEPAPAAGSSISKGTFPGVPGGAQDCCDIACQHACHMVAVLSVEPMTLSVAPLSRKPVEKADRDVPAVAFRIDHIPLA
jgi:hypothetical protein